MVRIIHLTDFHLDPKNLRDWKNYVKEPMINKFNELNESKKIGFIAFTGDIIDKGGKGYKNAAEAFGLFKKEVILPITENLQLPISKLLIIPGNHDVVRSEDSEREEMGNEMFFKDAAKLSNFMAEAMKNEDYSGMQRILEYKTFEKELYCELDKEMQWSVFGNAFKFNIGDELVGICCLNSA